MAKDLVEENKRLKELLKEAMPALCDYRVLKGGCGACKIQHYCLARKLIPKLEKEFNK